MRVDAGQVEQPVRGGAGKRAGGWRWHDLCVPRRLSSPTVCGCCVVGLLYLRPPDLSVRRSFHRLLVWVLCSSSVSAGGWRSFVWRSINLLLICPSLCLCLSLCFSLSVSLFLSVCLCLCLSVFYLSVCPSVCPSVSLSVSARLSVCLSVAVCSPIHLCLRLDRSVCFSIHLCASACCCSTQQLKLVLPCEAESGSPSRRSSRVGRGWLR